MPFKKKVTAIVVAGGRGLRMHSPLPKQFLSLKGKPVVQWSLECFDRAQLVEEIILVLPEDWLDEGRDKLVNFNPHKPFRIVAGGDIRQDSVIAGLDAVTCKNGFVAVHDGARPGLNLDILDRAIKKAFDRGNSVCVIPSNDTLIRVKDGEIAEQVDRSEIFRVQTPQIFPYEILREAMRVAAEKGMVATDEAGLVKACGHQIHLVNGAECNLKITGKDDLDMLSAIL